MTEELVMNEEVPNKSLEQSAIELGILDENGNEVNQDAPSERPSWLPEKFQSAEDMAKAYAELEAAQSRSNRQESASEETAQEPAKAEITEDEARDAASTAGVDFDALSAEYFENEGLTEESYQKLSDAGIPRHLVDQFIAGQEAVSQNQRDSILGEVGGEQKYAEMTAWAADNFSDGEIEAFNDTLQSGNPSAVRMAVAGLQARFEQGQSVEPARMVGGQKPSEQGGFESLAQLTDAMANPLYHSDPAYRAQVEKRIAASSIL